MICFDTKSKSLVDLTVIESDVDLGIYLMSLSNITFYVFGI